MMITECTNFKVSFAGDSFPFVMSLLAYWFPLDGDLLLECAHVAHP